jgi:hypothetical protein
MKIFFGSKNEHFRAKIKKHRSENFSHFSAPANPTRKTRVLYLEEGTL